MSEIIQSTTQQFLDIYDITNNFVIMKDGTVSTILTVDAMNFGLLAEEEQDAIMYAYAGLLNSLNYPIQIIIHSQTKDVTSYLKILQEQELQAENETMRRRIRMYREFVGNLIHERNVLDKKFYVVIPATALEMGFLATSSILPGSKAFDIGTVERSLIIEKAQNLLDPKRDHLIAQFARIGLYSRQLTTQEIIQLFYVRYNPEAIEGQQIGESTSYSTPLVKASIQQSMVQSIPPAAVFTNPTPTETPVATQPQVAQSAAVTLQPVPEIHIAAEPLLTSPEISPQPSATFTQPPVQTPLQQPLQPDVQVEYTAPQTQPTEGIQQPVVAAYTPPAPVTQTAPQAAAPITEVFTAPPDTVKSSTPSILSGVDGTSEQSIQADLNATVQSLGIAIPPTPAQPPVATRSPNPQAAQQQDLPPLPEI